MGFSIPIKVQGDEAMPIINAAIERNELRNSAIADLKEKTGCDDVLFSNGWGYMSFYLAFNDRQENPDYKIKKPFECGYYIHEPRAKTEFAKLLCFWSKKINEVPDLNALVKKSFPQFEYKTMEANSGGRGMLIKRPSFGMNADLKVIFGTLPSKDDLEIPKPWSEITITEMNVFSKAT